MQPGYAAIDELGGGELFGAYARTFPKSSRDAGRMLRVAVQIGQLERYQALLEGALRDRKPVVEEQWHGLCASVSWPRALPAWDRAPIEQWRLDITPDATPDWPEERLMGCHIDIGAGGPLAWQQRDLPRWLRDTRPPATSAARARVGLKVLAIAICATVLGLCLPSYETLDYWVGMAAFLVALLVAGTM